MKKIRKFVKRPWKIIRRRLRFAPVNLRTQTPNMRLNLPCINHDSSLNESPYPNSGTIYFWDVMISSRTVANKIVRRVKCDIVMWTDWKLWAWAVKVMRYPKVTIFLRSLKFWAKVSKCQDRSIKNRGKSEN